MTLPRGLGLTLLVFSLLGFLVAGPLGTILFDTIGSPAWGQVLLSRLSRNLAWEPLGTTLILGMVTALGAVTIGGFLAWLTVMTDIRFRRTLAVLATLPFMIPSFATALAWTSLFRNARTGGSVGLIEGWGVSVPDWLAWGLLPTSFVLIAQYYAMAYVVIAAALASLNGEVLEAGQMAGASRKRILFGIVLPMVTPALLAGGSLAFAAAVSNFAAPALLGLPVRMQTMSTRLFGMIEIGQSDRGYILALLLIMVSAVFLWAGNRLLAGRKKFAAIGGKGARKRTMTLGAAGWPLLGAALMICLITTILPVILLGAASFAPRSSELFSNWTLHYWIGTADPAFARGLPGVLRSPQLLSALWNTLVLGLGVALVAVFIGLLTAVCLTGRRIPVLTEAVNQLAFLPMLLPGIAFGAAYIALYGAPIGPFPALYGTIWLLALALIASSLPFAVQTGRATVAQIGGEIDEAARMTGASLPRRLAAITLPLASKGVIAGALLVFVNVIGDLAIVVLLYTPQVPVLSVLSYRYASDGFHQFANAVTLMILALSILATLLAQALKGRDQ